MNHKRRGKELLSLINIQKESKKNENESNIRNKQQQEQQEEREQEEINQREERNERNERNEDNLNEKILKNFRYLDSIINSLNNRKITTILDLVFENVTHMTGYNFTKEDLLVILTISPHSYIINQSNILQKKEIIITINNQWPSSNNMLNRYHVPIEARINEFRNLLNSTNLDEIKQKEEYLNYQMLLSINQNSNYNHNDQFEESTSHPRKKLKTISSSLREVVDMVATFQNLENEGVVVPTILSISPTSSSTTNFVSQTETQSIKSNKIDTLRSDIIKKSQIQIEKVRCEQLAQEQINQLSTAILLPLVVDTLRTLSRSKSKTIFSLDEIVKILTSSLRLHESKDNKDNYQVTGLKLVHRLAQEAPEFITIFPADEIILYQTVRMNMNAPIADLKVKLKNLSEIASIERDRIRNSIQSIGIIS